MPPRWEDRRAHVDALAQAALASADPAEAVRRALAREDAPLLPLDGRVYVVGAGKASLAMARAVLDVLGNRVAGGAVNVPPGQEESPLAPLALHPAAHPLPDERNLEGASAIAAVARQAGAGDLLLCLISGGGSAHLMLPAKGLSLGDLRAVTQALLLAGAPIEDLNVVRKHCEQLKGGGLARLAAPARVRSLILSDVVGDRLDVIASGPTAPDPTTYADALTVLDRYGARDAAPDVSAHLEAGARGERPETLKAGDTVLKEVENVIVGSNRLAMDGAADRARALGFAVETVGSPLTGEATDAARTVAGRAAQQPRPQSPHVIIFGGETTVTVRGEGRGGRNQELALAAALEIEGLEGVLVATLATDGIDGPTNAAGAIVTGETVRQARKAGLDPLAYLGDNDSHTFFEALDGLIVTGLTGTNVNDLAFVMRY